MARGYGWASYGMPKTTTISKTSQPLIYSYYLKEGFESFFGASPDQLPGQIDTRWWTSQTTFESIDFASENSYIRITQEMGAERFFFGGVGGASFSYEGLTSSSTAMDGTTRYESWSTGRTRKLDEGGQTIEGDVFLTKIVDKPLVVKIPKWTTTNDNGVGMFLNTATTTQEDYTHRWVTTLVGTKTTITTEETTFEGIALHEDYITAPTPGLTIEGEYEFTLGADAISEKIVVYDTVWVKFQNKDEVHTNNLVSGGNFSAQSTNTTGADQFSYVSGSQITVPWAGVVYQPLRKTSRQTTNTQHPWGETYTAFTTTTKAITEEITQWVNFRVTTEDEYIAHVIQTKAAEDWVTYATVQNGAATTLCSLNPDFKVVEFETETRKLSNFFANSSKIADIPTTVSYGSYKVTSVTDLVILNTSLFNHHQLERITSFPFANNIAELPWKTFQGRRYDAQSLVTDDSSKTKTTSFRSYPNSTHATSKKDETNETLKKDGIGVDFWTSNVTVEQGETSDGNWFSTYSVASLKFADAGSLEKQMWHPNGYNHFPFEKPFVAQQHAHPNAPQNSFESAFAGTITKAPLLISLEGHQHTIPFVNFEQNLFWTEASFVNQLAAALPIYPTYSAILNRNSDGGGLHTSDWSTITLSREGESISSTWSLLQNEDGARRTYTTESGTCKIITLSEYPLGLTNFQRPSYGQKVWTAGGAMHPNNHLLVWNAPQVWQTIGYDAAGSESGFSTDSDFGYQSFQAGEKITISHPVGIFWGYGAREIVQENVEQS